MSGVRHGVIEPFHATEFLAVDLMIDRVHQEGKWHLEGIVDLVTAEREREARGHERQRRQDAKAERGAIDVEIANRVDEALIKPDLLKSFAQRRVARRAVGRFDLATGKSNLAGVIVEM